ncbi:alcohol dehydrogenase [Nocardioides baekrokdamisoli]|uniref:hydroxyacid-oxoacid transhydrogenase n=1 Tax=Nocardioides baekrokdamisoli TaxID=1804624 RepID=A0A3G9J460_9ACTN|nr:hydroxyacid-oxoacid transhydrogenase [Nocardioides baekrokdamisoli]BBH17809.1 alcohol dehydrogenase [Nocardioides baekrokdamisoli]
MCETAFTVDASRVTFGAGALAEVGPRMAAHVRAGARVALMTDPVVAAHAWPGEVAASLRDAGFDVVTYDAVGVEPTDESVLDAVAWARETRPDAYVSVGGGSVIDTAKIADLLASQPGELADYVNVPLGGGRAVAAPIRPHIACPTTSGTGSEVTGIAIFDLLSKHAKTGMSSPRLRPTEAVIDPRVTATLPPAVVAASGLDVLCHAVESLTARPYTSRPAPSPVTARLASQGANPWSDVGAEQALRVIGANLRDAVAGDEYARHQMMWAATLAGIAFGNAGVHVPHAMAYAVAGRVRDYCPEGYPQGAPLVPHGFAVAVNAPAVFRATAHTSPVRHLAAAEALGAADMATVGPDEVGEALAAAVTDLMRDIGAPNGLVGVGYTEADIPALVEGSAPQRRLLDNAPLSVGEPELAEYFRAALSCW